MIDNKFFIDCETLPSDSTALLATLRANVKPPGQYKVPASIDKWLAENRESEALEAFGKTGLDGLYGRICVAGFAIGDKPVTALRLDAYDSERIFLERLFVTIDLSATDEHGFVKPLEVVGHNVEFDVKFLFHRAVRYGLKLPKCLARAFGPEARYVTHDTMTMWCRYRERVSLRNLARELLDDDCSDIDGSQVAAAWAKNPDSVVKHCIADVERTRKLFVMMQAVMP